jgi:hypothetical protein
VERRIVGYKFTLIALGAGLVAGLAGYLLAPPLAEAQQRMRIAHAPGPRGANVSGGQVHTRIQHARGSRGANVSGGRVFTQLQGAPGPRNANVSGGALHTQVMGGFVDVSSPTMVIDAGDEAPADPICDGIAIVDGVTATGTGQIEVTGDEDFDGTAEDVIWRGVATAESGMAETMFGGKQLFSGRELQVTVDPTIDNWIVYGFCEDAAGFGGGGSAEMRAKAREAMGR